MDPEGRYDASDEGNVPWPYWIVGEEQVSLLQLRDGYYDPGLLSKILGSNKKPLRKVRPLDPLREIGGFHNN